MQSRYSLLFGSLVIAVAGSTTGGQEPASKPVLPAPIAESLEQNCLACHDQYSREGDFDLESLSFELSNPETFHAWQYALDRVKSGEMPPDDDLDPELRAKFVETLGHSLHEFDARRIASQGRVPARRLTNVQYENSVQKMLGVNIPLADLLPAESLSGGFDTVSASQQISDHLMGAYLRAADLAVEAAFDAALNPAEPHSVRLDWTELRRNEKRTNREPEGRPEHQDIVSWSTLQNFYGKLPATTASQSGRFRIRVRVHAVNPPKQGHIWATLRSGACSGKDSTLYWIDSFEVTEKPSVHEFTAWVRKGHMLQLRPESNGLKKAPPKGGRGSIRGPAGVIESMGVPGIAVKWVQIERLDPEVERVRRLLFADTLAREDSDAATPAMAEGSSKTDVENLWRLSQRFATDAFRRNVTKEEVAPYIELAEGTLRETGSLVQALKTSYLAILCSPRFLYLDESPGELDSYAIASRLSYCLWGMPPDNELRQAAKSGVLREPAKLREQTERLLSDPKASHFVRSFTDQWLQLYELQSTTPDAQLYPEYDDVLHNSLSLETHRFIAELLKKNLSVVNLVDSDFTFLNSRLAKHYGVDWPGGLGLQKVNLKPSDHRGGVITHGSILKVTANGTTTSPIVRGVWMLERIMGQHVPPPPANVPAVEPDIRGAVTIRDQLDKHRDLESCAVCHVKIDPPGFALESYDVIGGYRERYRKMPTGGKRRWQEGPPVDPSSEMTTGESFFDLEGLQEILSANPEQIARCFASQFLTYATGAKPSFADRKELDRIVASAEKNGFGLRSIVHAVIQSKLFLNK